MEKSFISIKDIDDCKNFVVNPGTSPSVLNITVQNDNYDCLKYLTENAQKIKDNIAIVNLHIPYEFLPKKDFEILYNLSTQLYNSTFNVIVNHGFVDEEYSTDKKGSVFWKIKTIIKANQAIHGVCDFIKNNNFSPFEAYAFVHNFVSTIAKYNASSIAGTWLSNDQFFVGAFLDLPEVVCMGYSALEKEIIDNLNMPGLQCDIISISFRNKDKQTSELHARCFVRVLDDKYEIDQSCYEDATWDNIEPSNNQVPLYAHFAMDNNCHEQTKNDKYIYNYPALMKFSPKHVKNIVDFESYWEYNKSKNPISQLQIERAYFNILVKSKPDMNFESLYSTLTQMAKQSYNEQLSRRFDGNLIQAQPILTQKMAKQIFDQAKQNINTNCLSKTTLEIEI